MILKIAHRILNLEDYYKLPQKVGLEFDIHAYGDQLVVSHDAFCDGIKFEEYISKVKDRFLAINIKEEGIEKRVFDILSKEGCEKFFLFDVTVPQIFRLGKLYSKHFAFRLSQIEKINFKYCREYADYIWIDTFDGTFWLNKDLILELKNLSFKLCFVSPELHKPPLGDSNAFNKKLNSHIPILDNNDMVCTKYYK
tara:strand:- start:278 stop:865 length:588 start_codon:yes stop_codon:yes gene_type:complete